MGGVNLLEKAEEQQRLLEESAKELEQQQHQQAKLKEALGEYLISFIHIGCTEMHLSGSNSHAGKMDEQPCIGASCLSEIANQNLLQYFLFYCTILAFNSISLETSDVCVVLNTKTISDFRVANQSVKYV